MLQLYKNGIVLVFMMICNESLASLIKATYKQTAIPRLYDKDDYIMKELQVETKTECGIKCLQNSCTGFLFKIHEQLGDIQCYSSASYLDYTGTYNKTITGQTCQRWDDYYPHTHIMNASLIPENTLTEAENYCRDPDLSGYLWCYTIDPSTRWESCDVMTCMSHATNCRLYNYETVISTSSSLREEYKYYILND